MTEPFPFVVRELSGLSDLALTVRVAAGIWGEMHPAEAPALLHVRQDTGGLVAGAFGAGVPSDRFEARLAKGAAEDWTGAEALRPLRGARPGGLPTALAVHVPDDDYTMIRNDKALVLEWRQRSRPVSARLLGDGYALLDMDLPRQRSQFRRSAC